MDRYVDLTCSAPVRLGDIFRAYYIVVASLLLNCCSGGPVFITKQGRFHN